MVKYDEVTIISNVYLRLFNLVNEGFEGVCKGRLK